MRPGRRWRKRSKPPRAPIKQAIAAWLRSHTVHTVVGDIAFGKDGEWAKSRVFFTQFQHVTGNSLDQFQGHDPRSRRVAEGIQDRRHDLPLREKQRNHERYTIQARHICKTQRGGAFAAIVLGDDVIDLRNVTGSALTSTESIEGLLEDWDANFAGVAGRRRPP